jgi:hypothetical protein
MDLSHAEWPPEFADSIIHSPERASQPSSGSWRTQPEPVEFASSIRSEKGQ